MKRYSQNSNLLLLLLLPLFQHRLQPADLALKPALAAYRGRVFSLASASPGRFGGVRSLLALRQVLEVGCGALVLPEQICIPRAEYAFDERGNLSNADAAGELRQLVRRLVELAGQIP